MLMVSSIMICSFALQLIWLEVSRIKINRAIRQNNARPSVFSSDNAHNLTNEYHRANYVRPIKAIQLFAHAPSRVSCERCPIHLLQRLRI